MADTREGARYRVADLIEYATALFAAAGCDGDKPAAIAAGLVEADLLGHTTHGLQLAPAYLRELDGQTMLVVNNLSNVAQPAELDLRDFVGRVPTELVGNHAFPRIEDRPYFLSLSPHSFYWFRLDAPAGGTGGTP